MRTVKEIIELGKLAGTPLDKAEKIVHITDSGFFVTRNKTTYPTINTLRYSRKDGKIIYGKTFTYGGGVNLAISKANLVSRQIINRSFDSTSLARIYQNISSIREVNERDDISSLCNHLNTIMLIEGTNGDSTFLCYGCQSTTCSKNNIASNDILFV